MTFRRLARTFHSSAPRLSTEGGHDGIVHLAGEVLKNPLFQFGGVLVSVMYTGASFLHGEIKDIRGDIKDLRGDIMSVEAKLEADRKEACLDRRQMQATLNEILKTQRRSWW